MVTQDKDSDRTLRAFAFVSRELQGCFGHLATVLDAHLNGEELPSSLFAAPNGKPKAKPRKTRSDKGEKRTRKPTAFNIFVKRKLEEMKASGAGGEPKVLFRTAVEEWSKLSDAQRAKFTEDYRAEIEALGDAGTPAPPEAEEPTEATPEPTTEPSPKKTPAAAQQRSGAAKAPTDSEAAARADGKKEKKKRSHDKERDTDGEKKKKKKKKRDKERGQTGETADGT